MARVILVFNKKVIKEYPFSKESLTIGRDEGNDIAIDSVQELLVGENYKAKAKKEFIRHKFGFYAVYRDTHDISQL